MPWMFIGGAGVNRWVGAVLEEVGARVGCFQFVVGPCFDSWNSLEMLFLSYTLVREVRLCNEVS